MLLRRFLTALFRSLFPSLHFMRRQLILQGKHLFLCTRLVPFPEVRADSTRAPWVFLFTPPPPRFSGLPRCAVPTHGRAAPSEAVAGQRQHNLVGVVAVGQVRSGRTVAAIQINSLTQPRPGEDRLLHTLSGDWLSCQRETLLLCKPGK